MNLFKENRRLYFKWPDTPSGIDQWLETQKSAIEAWWESNTRELAQYQNEIWDLIKKGNQMTKYWYSYKS